MGSGPCLTGWLGGGDAEHHESVRLHRSHDLPHETQLLFRLLHLHRPQNGLDYLNSFRRFDFNTYVHIHCHYPIDQFYQHCNELPNTTLKQ